MTVIEHIEAGRIIAILRGDFGGRENEIVQVLADGAIRSVEVTLNSPGAFDSIRRIAESFGSRLAVGAGTVLTIEEVKRSADAGAQFIVSPNRDPRVIAAAKKLRLAVFPGCFTPSEIVEALEAGADAAKLFPAQCLGAPFIKALRGPLPNVRLIPTGGVTPDATREYLAAGAWAVGVGSELLGRELRNAASLQPLRQRVTEYVKSAKAGVAAASPF